MISMDILNYIPTFLLVFMRMTGLFVLSPVFGRRNVPAYLKIGMSFMMAMVLLNTIPLQSIDIVNNIWLYVWILFKEMLIGLAMGYITTLAFSAILIAGQIMDFQIGFGMVNAFDPVNEVAVPIVGNLINMMALLLFFGMNGHHVLISLLFDSYTVLPIGDFSIKPDILWYILEIFVQTFVWAIKLAIPLMAVLLLTEVMLGVLSRALPQMNVFVMGMPIRLMIGLIMLLLVLPVYINLMEPLFADMFDDISGFMQRMVR
ncbi:flagellar biosynthetic protein FliR [Mahella australiensis 50-1 BON]|uniref:Flagellar biosynthetic protein FliR n=2 Tax=Mahella TaxID=252965 RepID=F4A1V4_MAHA5|nr:flagellar biosynthetic protein FliR [Mahella australiensis 50-1 BON]